MHPAGLLLLCRRHEDPRQSGGLPGAADDHNHLQRRRERRQHRLVRGHLQRATSQSQRLSDTRHLLRLAQVHQLLGGAGLASQGPRDFPILVDAQGRSAVLESGQLRRLDGGDGRRAYHHREIRKHQRWLGYRREGPLPASGWQQAVPNDGRQLLRLRRLDNRLARARANLAVHAVLQDAAQVQRKRRQLSVEVTSNLGDGAERARQEGRPDLRRVTARLSHGGLLLQHPERRSVRQTAQAQLQSPLQHQQGAAWIQLPRLVAQEQKGV